MTSPPASLRGALRPRVEHRPDGIVETLGPRISELATLAGLPPDPWQADAHELMMSLRSDGNWAAKDYAEWVGRQQGKTGGIGIPRVLAGLFLLPERMFLWSAHEAKTSTEAFEAIRDALLTLGDEIKPDLIEVEPLDIEGALQESLFVQVISANGKEGFRAWTADRRQAWRKRLLMVARTRGSGRGFPADVRFIDEAFAYTPTQQSALAPTRLAKPYSQTIYLSSPPLDGESGEVMYRLRERAIEEHDPRLGYRDWGLEMTLDAFLRMKYQERRAFLYDRDNWVVTLPALGLGRVTEESVEDLIKEFAREADAAREVFGTWPVQIRREDGGWQIIPAGAWRSRGGLRGDTQADSSVSFCLDASWPDAAWGAIGVAGRLGDETLVQVVEHRPGTGWMVRRAVELRDRHPDAVFVLDKKGPAGFLLNDLEEAGVEVITPAMEDIARTFGQFVAAVTSDEPYLRHYDQPELDDAVKAAGARPLGDARTWARQGEVDISPLTAVTGALHGVHERSAEPWAVWA